MFRRSASRITSLLIRKRRVLPWRASGHAPLGALLLVGGVGLVGGVSGFGAPLVSVLTPPGQTDLHAATARQALSPDDPDDVEPILRQYCMVCHNQTLNTAGLALETLDLAVPSEDAEVWEKVIRKLRTRTMPPGGSRRPDEADYDVVASWLEEEIDRPWAASPNPGRVGTVHRLNVTEYENAIRDLFAIEPEVRSLLPGDETADGSFDNFADVLSFTQTHQERHLSVARMVTRMAVGLPPRPTVQRFEVPLHMVQDHRQSEDLPFGSRGGVAIPFDSQADAEYVIKVQPRRNWQEYIMGMGWPQQLDIRVDGRLVKRFTIGGDAPGRPAPVGFAGPAKDGDPEWEVHMTRPDIGLEVRVPIDAGPHVIGVSFLKQWWEPDGVPQPQQRGRLISNDEIYWDRAAVHLVEIGGPYNIAGLAKDTPSRREIFVCEPEAVADEVPCARRILSRMARRAYRRPVTDQEVQRLLGFVDSRLQDGGSFDEGIQSALEYMLVSPSFLFRVYDDPPGVAPGETYRLSDLEVASRLSFFLWSSIPDENLLELAERGELTDPEIVEQEARRMLADPRAIDALVTDFAGQWLNLRRVREVVVDPLVYPNYDVNLLEGFQRETELFLASLLREDRSVLELINADYTYVNERLARHYGIPGVDGSRFRRVTIPNMEQRGGLLGQGSILAISSYPDRTSPVLRGKWLLDNILGSPPPPPPPNVDTNLPDATPGAVPTSIRDRLEQHRTDPVCSSCHSLIDPLGFALENFDVIGGWRTVDKAGNPVYTEGAMPSGVELHGFTGLRESLQSERFVSVVTEKLLAYALGRRLDYYDQPSVRQIVREAAADDYRWSSIIVGIVQSPAFLMRMSN